MGESVPQGWSPLRSGEQTNQEKNNKKEGKIHTGKTKCYKYVVVKIEQNALQLISQL